MEIAFLNLCHCEPEIVSRVANKLTANKHFDMYIHVDAKTDITPFKELLKENSQVRFIEHRRKVYWGGYNAIHATIELLTQAMSSDKNYDYFVLLQNLDYPIKSNQYIYDFFENNKGTQFIRGCKIAKTKDWHYARKYKIYNKRDDDFYRNQKSKIRRKLHNAYLAARSITTITFNGVIKDQRKAYPIYYGAAQWAITRDCANYILEFEKTHKKFNQKMSHIQFPDEEYFHTIVHNSQFKYQCCKFDEPVQRWLVNWRNLHYFEFPKEVTVFTKKDFETIISQESLFCRKVKSEVSGELMDLIDAKTSC